MLQKGIICVELCCLKCTINTLPTPHLTEEGWDTRTSLCLNNVLYASILHMEEAPPLLHVLVLLRYFYSHKIIKLSLEGC